MNRSTFALIFTSVLMSSIAQIVLKGGMTQASVTSAGATGMGLEWVRAVAMSPMVVGGLAIYFASALVWLAVLSRVDVSLAYPFVGLGFVVTMLLAWVVHGETLTMVRITGTLMICAGVVVLAKS